MQGTNMNTIDFSSQKNRKVGKTMTIFSSFKNNLKTRGATFKSKLLFRVSPKAPQNKKDSQKILGRTTFELLTEISTRTASPSPPASRSRSMRFKSDTVKSKVAPWQHKMDFPWLQRIFLAGDYFSGTNYDTLDLSPTQDASHK